MSKHHHGFLHGLEATGHNLVQGTEDLFKGLGPGAVAIGKAVVHDAKNVAHGGGGHYELGDIGKSILHDYKQRYAPLFTGDFKGFAQQVEKHPLDFILDATTLAGGAFGAAGKAGEVAASSGAAAREGSLAARAARAAGYVPRTAENVGRASEVYGALSKEVRAGEKSGLVKGVRVAGTSDKLGKDLLLPRERNPLKHARDVGVDRALGAHPLLEKAPLVGLNARVSRSVSKGAHLRKAVHAGEIARVAKKVRGLNHTEQLAWGLKHEGLDPAELADRIEQTLKDAPSTSKIDVARSEKRIELLRSDELKSVMEKPSKRLANAVTATQEYANGPLAQIVTDAMGMDMRQQIERRLQPGRLAKGAEMTTEHPTLTQPTEESKKAVEALKQSRADRLEKRSALGEKIIRGDKTRATRQAYDELAQPTADEHALELLSRKREPVALKGHDAPDGGTYNANELVNPDTGQLYRDETAHLTDAQHAALADGSSYRPHMAANEGRGGGRVSAERPVMTEPGAPSNITHGNTGRRMLTGTDEVGPHAFLRTAARVARSAYAKDLYDRTTPWARPFNLEAYHNGGGARAWTVFHEGGVHALEQKLGQATGGLRELEGLIPEDQLASLVQNLGDKSSELAAIGSKTPDGLVMIPKDLYQRIAGDLHESSAFVKNVIDRPLDVFRSLVLFARPAYYANNLVGQNMQLLIRDGGPMFVPRYIKFLASKGNLAGARDVFGAAVRDETTSHALWDQVFRKAGVNGASMGHVELGGDGLRTSKLLLSPNRRTRMFAQLLHAPQTANEIGAVLTDDIPRQFRFVRLITPHIHAARDAGMAGDDATIAMHLMENDPKLAERITAQTMFDLVDYRGMSKFERTVLRRIIPFYGWLRGITTWTAELGYNHPEELLKLAQVAHVGNDTNAKFDAGVPDWLKGSILVGKAKGGKQRVIGTQGLNPLSTIGDMIELGKGAFGDDPSRSLTGGTLAGQVNPFALAFAQAALNKGNTFATGMPMLMPGQSMNRSAAVAGPPHRPGWLGAGALGWLATTPQAMLATQYRTARDNQAMYGSPSTPSAVYSSPFRDYLMSYLGYPVRNVNLAGALQRRNDDLATAAGEGSAFR